MNRALVDRIAGALLYEGYLLYPYRRSVKNRQRWTFGGLYPPSYTAAQTGSDASEMQTQCLVRGCAGTTVTATVRFLQLVARRVGQYDVPLQLGAGDEVPPPDRHVESLALGDTTFEAWQEAIEREIPLGTFMLNDLAERPRWLEFSFAERTNCEPVGTPRGPTVGVVERLQRGLEGGAELSTCTVGDALYQVTLRIENRTHLNPEWVADRDEALLRSLVSTHTLLGVEQGEFLSLLDPPEEARELAAACRNIGTWPVLVGEEGETDTLLSSPIILYDYPEIAPESPGDLFDATEIDEILTLRILTMTDEEKRAMAALDVKGRALLERTEALGRAELMSLHGTLREPRAGVGSGRDDHGPLGSSR